MSEVAVLPCIIINETALSFLTFIAGVIVMYVYYNWRFLR